MLLGADTPVVETTLVQIAKAIVIFAVIFAIVPVLTVVERKLLGRFQSRYGPNRVGPYGLIQPVADALKLLSKEQSTPATAVPWMMALAPVIIVGTARGHAGDHPVRARRAPGAATSASTASTCRSGCCGSSPSARSRSTRSCSAAGPRGRSTRSSARCAPPRS